MQSMEGWQRRKQENIKTSENKTETLITETRDCVEKQQQRKH